MFRVEVLFYLTLGQLLVTATSENVSHQVPRPLELNLTEERSLKPSLMDVMLQLSAREGLDAMLKFYSNTESHAKLNDQFLSVNHPGALLSKFSSPEMATEQSEMAAYATLSAAKAFRKHYKASNDFARQAHPQKISLRRTALEALCPPRDSPKCVPASERYRTHDGTCNNKRRPRWGAAQMPFNRFLPPEYGDGIDSVRVAVDGTPLSSARFVSLLIHGAKKGDAAITLMTAQWGQLLDHDMTATAQPRPVNGSVPSCCGSNDFHPSCFPIKVPLDDPWLASLKVRCLEFLRSAPAQRRDCVLSWREQTNQATAYIDASPIYSNSVRLSDNTRTFKNGTLMFGRGNPREDVCHRGALATQCIRSGDGRSSEQPGLLALHQVWVGEHNRIAQELVAMNAHWSDEKVYQESRRIVGAMFQHITYREFLPIVLGREVCKLFDLELVKTGYYTGYDAKVNPTVANAFSAAAFRFGHSLIQDSYMRCDRHHNVISNNVSLHEEFQRGDIGSAGSLHRLLRGMSTQRALKRDEFITPELTNHLFQTPGFPFGLDLAAINIQRGRDHGIAPYTAWRVPCGLTPIQNWEDLSKVVGPESAKRISHAYRSVHDVDLFVGGISERPVVSGLVGPTFACIIAQQFSNIRKGDRFWYENGGMENSFTPAQLQSIRQVLFAQVLCRAVGEGTFQSHIFIPADVTGNERMPCGQGPLAPINLMPWKERDLPIEESPSNLNMQTSMADKRFDVVTSKPNKSGFQNRMPLPDMDDIAPTNKITMTMEINDKLDIKRKQTHSKRPKPMVGINNKLDKDNKGTPNGHRRHNHRPKTRRVIINNVPMELRTTTRNHNSTDQHTFKTSSLNNKQRDLPTTDDLSFEGSNRKDKSVVLKTENASFAEPKQYTVRDYTVAQKPHGDEYEIEIKIRQTNRDYVIRSTTPYAEHETSYLPFNTYTRYSPQNELPYTETTAHYGPYNGNSSPQPNRRTRPPTIIYLDEPEDRLTTRKPAKLPNFMSFTRPQSANQKTSSKYESIVSSGGLAITQPTITHSLSPNYSFKPQLPYNSPYNLPNAASTFNQIGTQHGGGAHVSSTSVSAGNFGSISGQTTAHGGDTSFSFNIRPKLPSNSQSYFPPVKPSASYTELPKPNIFSEYGNLSPMSKPQISEYQNSGGNEWSNQSPFSTASKRPNHNYYSRRPYEDIEQKEHKTEDVGDLYFSKIYSDYEYDGKTWASVDDNDTSSVKGDDETDFEDYNEHIANGHNINVTDRTETIKEDEGIFKPEEMTLLLLQKEDQKPINGTNFDDTYVLPILNISPTDQLTTLRTDTSPIVTTTDFTNNLAKNARTEIFAEDDFEQTEKLTKTLDRNTATTRIVAFAPIRVLTKPERPDNWLMFEVSKEQVPLPSIPIVWTESESTVEVPSPLRNMTEIWLTKLLNSDHDNKNIEKHLKP